MPTPAHHDARHAERAVTVTSAPYNAAGDGTTNDRAAIQRAIDELARVGGGTVVLPAGRVFMSGNLTLADNIRLKIDGILKQSQIADHYTYEPIYGHRKPGAPQSYITWFDNLPLIFARDARNVVVTGQGVVQMTHSELDVTDPSDFWSYRGVGADHHTIHVVPIALYKVDGFEVSDISILYGNTHHILVYWSRSGVVRGTTIKVFPTKESFGRHHVANTDAVQIGNSQDVRVTGNHFDQIDNTVVVISRYNDPREATAWWTSSEQRPCRDIEIDHNFIRTSHGGTVFLPWAPDAPDQEMVEISDVNIHDNVLDVGIQPHVARDDYVYRSAASAPGHSPLKRIRILDNTYRYIGRHDRGLTRRARITDLKTDFRQTSQTDFLNGDFKSGLANWSHRGQAGAITSDPSALHDPAARLMAQRCREEWVSLGYIQDFTQDSALYQGLGLVDGIRYTLRLNVVTGGDAARLFVVNTSTGRLVSELPVDNTEPKDVSLTFRAEGTCDSYHVGIDRDTARTGWALVSSASLRPMAEILASEDHRIRYTGSWTTINDVNLVSSSYRETSQPGASARISFSGTRAWVFGLRDWVYGNLQVHVDGECRETVSLFNDGSWPAWVDHQVLYDTGQMEQGEHTIVLVCTGTKDARSNGTAVAFDAVMIE